MIGGGGGGGLVDSQCRQLIHALSAWAAWAYTTTARAIATEFQSFMNIPEKEIQIRLKLLQTITIPKVCFNSETWTNLTKWEMEKIDSIVSGSLKKLIGLPRTTPTLGLYAETGIAPSRHHIAQKMFMLLHRIKSGEPQKLIKIYEEQKQMDLPKCWYQEIKTIKQKYKLNDISDKELGAMSKAKWKNIAKKAIQNELPNELENASEVNKKLRDI